jgi:twitching motility protein PilJ
LAERILGAVNTVLAGDDTAVKAADAFGRDANRFGQVLATACSRAVPA